MIDNDIFFCLHLVYLLSFFNLFLIGGELLYIIVLHGKIIWERMNIYIYVCVCVCVCV